MKNASLLVSIVDFEPRYAQAFHDINLQWLEEMFEPEPLDLEILRHPIRSVIEPGGHIMIALLDGEPVGAGALKRVAPGVFELTKMGVLPQAQGHKIGSRLLAALVDKAKQLQASELYLLSSWSCEAAIHLYERFGFVHDERIMKEYGVNYQRCEVAMSYPLE